MQNISVGQYVKHFQYGCGVIKEYDASRTTIDFDIHGMKKFVTNLMVIEQADGTPPKRKRKKKIATEAGTATMVAGAK